LKKMPQLDHLYLDGISRRLIALACARGENVALAPLDKGLSGSAVWLARWTLPGGIQSKLHVLKIGPHRKLSVESNAIRDIASVIDPGQPHAALFALSDHPDDDDPALLRQEFLGDVSGNSQSLREYLSRSVSDLASARDVIHRLYGQRLARWHPSDDSAVAPLLKNLTFGSAMEPWLKHADLRACGEALGLHAIDASLAENCGISVELLSAGVDEISAMPSDLAFGPVHGDLHAQNVLVDEAGELQLIDYGWTGERWRAVDFLMMECSLKFLVAPPHAVLGDLLAMETVLEPALLGDDIDITPLSNAILGDRLCQTAAAVAGIRQAALATAAVRDAHQYRSGLLLMTAGHSTMPGGLNQVFLLHSLGHHVREALVQQ